jgi:hypothetical protein
MGLAKTELLRIPVLGTVGGEILLGSLAKKIDTQKLESVSGDFLAGVATQIAPRLRNVGGIFSPVVQVTFTIQPSR